MCVRPSSIVHVCVCVCAFTYAQVTCATNKPRTHQCVRAYIRFTRTHAHTPVEMDGGSTRRISHNNELCRFSQFQLTSHATRTTLRYPAYVSVCVRV